MASYTADNNFVNSYIGEGTAFQGDLSISGILRVDGDFIGSIHSEGKVIIGSTGRARCTVHSREIVIGGVFKGDIYCSHKVTVLSSGFVIGNIYAPRLEVERGMLMDGRCVVTPLPNESEDLTSHNYKIQKGGYFSLDWDNKSKPDGESASVSSFSKDKQYGNGYQWKE
ncbi:bactofilin family protein [Spirochaeta cellobiosiphila]|uniref:bactofilin family protein n=1 Tax=Spirochaeta cellobiosiphila TaxID=504483 RepID=UPI000422714F|nr:polymer-forming cytoskeletal protein [Spirochaeta cellobiosiphila]